MVVPSYQSATIGESVIFYCISDQLVQWWVNGHFVMGENMQKGKISNSDRYFLKIYVQFSELEGAYLCSRKENGTLYYDEAELEIHGEYFI